MAVTQNDRPIDLLDLEAARIEAIRRIWAILEREKDIGRGLNRHVTITTDAGGVLLVVSFAEALAADQMGFC